MNTKRYLGDSVYAQFDGFGFWLTTENGLVTDPSNRIYLEPEVIEALYEFQRFVYETPVQPSLGGPMTNETPEKDKWLCNECGWHGRSEDLLTATNPFDDSEEITGCPQCRQPEKIQAVCDEPSCWYKANYGTPNRHGPYRMTCLEHQPKEIQ